MSLTRIISQGIELIEQERYAEAKKLLAPEYKKIRGMKPRPAVFEHLSLNLARVAVGEGNYKVAEIILKEALRDNPNNDSCLYSLGKIYEAWVEKANHLSLARSVLEGISSRSLIKKDLLNDVVAQQEIKTKIENYEGKPTEYFGAQELTQLGFLIKDIDELEVCSEREEFYFRIAQVYSNVKNASFKRKREEGKSLSEVMNQAEFAALDRVLNHYIQKAGFDL